MDTKFHPAVAAIKSGDVDALRALINEDPSLATARSTQSHPTLLQCVALESVDQASNAEMAQVLIAAGAELEAALVAAASIDNVVVAKLLLDCGASINGNGGWSPLEEALYWRQVPMIDLLLERGASLHNLRIAAALGRTDLIEGLFASDDTLKPEAGKIDWPFGDLVKANSRIGKELQAKAASWTNDDQDVINNAFVYACMHDRLEAAKLLLQKGAQLDAIPPGFDFGGTGLHYAALNGHRSMVEFLISQGANVNIKDTKVHSTPAGWADHGGHAELSNYLSKVGASKD
ncbi:MAG TPA: ankyrin repeat domain-containing protein [Pyrinomonadaceae bacterium]|nr:ankyrin repeat domain-containing protein [Pyrinomonadaceae bacterium]